VNQAALGVRDGMAHLTRIRIGLLAAAGLVLIATVLIFAMPGIPDERSIRNSVVEHLSKWTGATVSITGRTRLNYFPRPALIIPNVKLSGIKRLPALRALQAKSIEVRLGLWSLFSRTPVVDRITFVEPRIEASSAGAAAGQRPTEKLAQRLIRTLETAPVDQIRLENGALTVTGPATSEQFTAITAKINLQRPGGAHSGRGTFTWRGQAVSFNYEGEKREKAANPLTFPVSVAIDGDLISAQINGTAIVSNGVRITGNLNLGIPNLPRFARWTGVLVPEDQKTGEFSANGTFHWEGYRIGFDEGTFELDGNRALGAVTLDFGGPRPQLEGTLALQRLDLTRYIEAGSPAPASSNPGVIPAKPKTIDIGFPLLHHINLDLRISTTELRAPPIAFGQSALSVTLKAGRLAADIAVFELCGGNGNIRLEFDASVPDSALRLTANINAVSAETCIEIFTAKSRLEGTASMTADITSKGRTAKELLDTLGGKISLSMTAGQADVDVPKLISSLRDGPVRGWKAVQGSATAFETLTGEFFLRPGAVYTDSLKINLGSRYLTGDGTIDLAGRGLDMRMKLMVPPPKDAPAETKQTESARGLAGDIVIKGPWSDPSFTLEPVKKNASAPQLDPARTAQGRNFYR